MQEENDVDKCHFFVINGFISQLRNDDKLYYLACPNDNCRRKVTEEYNGRYRCESCSKSFNMCNPTFMIIAKITDFTDSLYVHFTRENGTVLMGKSASLHL